MLPGSCASAEAVAHIAVQKYVMGSPLYRQEQEWNRQGVMLSRQTMSNWLLRCADDWLAPIYEELRKQPITYFCTAMCATASAEAQLPEINAGSFGVSTTGTAISFFLQLPQL